MALIEVKSVNKTYEDPITGRRVKTLESINLKTDEKDFLVLLGPSGCGKSTVLNMIAGLTPPDPDGGQVVVRGRRVSGPNPQLIAYMFQDPVLYPWRTVLKNVEFGLEAQGLSRDQRRERALKYLKLVGLDNCANAYPHQLSGGMSQRVALCRSLALETEIILMDEPFAALDEQTRLLIGDELLSIWREVRRTIVFVTHSLTEAVYLSQRIAVFSAAPGRIKAEIKNHLPRPRRIGSADFNNLVEELWQSLKEEALSSFNKPAAGRGPTLVPNE